MSLRLTIPAYQKLIVVSNKSGFSFSYIGNSALRKWNRLHFENIVASFDLCKSDHPLMEQPTNIRFKPVLVEGKSPGLLRHILSWYLDDFEKKYKKPVPLEIDIEELYRAANKVELAEQIIGR